MICFNTFHENEASYKSDEAMLMEAASEKSRIASTFRIGISVNFMFALIVLIGIQSFFPNREVFALIIAVWYLSGITLSYIVYSTGKDREFHAVSMFLDDSGKATAAGHAEMKKQRHKWRLVLGITAFVYVILLFQILAIFAAL